MGKYILLWLPMVLLAILNGIARDFGYARYLNEHAARQISTVVLLILLALYIRITLKKYPPRTASTALFIGFIWGALTVVFEFGLGRYNGLSWVALLSDYNILKGRLWGLVPLWIVSAPYVFYRLQFK